MSVVNGPFINMSQELLTTYPMGDGEKNFLEFGLLQKKLPESTSETIPQQSFYTRTWNQSPNDSHRFKALKAFIRKTPLIYRIARKANQVLNIKSFIKKRPKIIARY